MATERAAPRAKLYNPSSGTRVASIARRDPWSWHVTFSCGCGAVYWEPYLPEENRNKVLTNIYLMACENAHIHRCGAADEMAWNRREGWHKRLEPKMEARNGD